VLLAIAFVLLIVVLLPRARLSGPSRYAWPWIAKENLDDLKGIGFRLAARRGLAPSQATCGDCRFQIPLFRPRCVGCGRKCGLLAGVDCTQTLMAGLAVESGVVSDRPMAPFDIMALPNTDRHARDELRPQHHAPALLPGGGKIIEDALPAELFTAPKDERTESGSCAGSAQSVGSRARPLARRLDGAGTCRLSGHIGSRLSDSAGLQDWVMWCRYGPLSSLTALEVCRDGRS
jgi:hypothetical protein